MYGSVLGSMSAESSGHITTSGACREPALTCAASCSVAAAWLPVTSVSASCFASVRECGTLPCTAATSAVGTPVPGSPDGSRPPATTSPAAAAKPSAGTIRRRTG